MGTFHLPDLAITPLEDPSDPEARYGLRSEGTRVIIALIGDVRGRDHADLLRQADQSDDSRRVTRGTVERFLRSRSVTFEASLEDWGQTVTLHVSSLEDFGAEALCAQLESAVYVAPAIAARAVDALRGDERFQACEATWRTIDALLSSGPPGLTLEILDAGPDELDADLADGSSVQRSELWRALHQYNHPAIHPRHQLMVLARPLSTSGRHDALLMRLTDFAWRANIPLVAIAESAADAATESVALTLWRETELASWVGLCSSSILPTTTCVVRRLFELGWGGPLDADMDLAAGRGPDPTRSSLSVTLLVSRLVNELYDIHYRRVWCRGSTTDADVAATLEAGLTARLGRRIGLVSVRPAAEPVAFRELELSLTLPGSSGAPGTIVTRRVRVPGDD